MSMHWSSALGMGDVADP